MIERSIQMLDPLAQQNRIMSEQERNTWQLPADFGGPIHKKTVAKIYGRAKVDAVMHGQATNPANVVPVMLLRMRQFAEQWKGAQVSINHLLSPNAELTTSAGVGQSLARPNAAYVLEELGSPGDQREASG